MTDWMDQMVAQAARAAGDLFAMRDDWGRLVWSQGDTRLYRGSCDGCGTLTYVVNREPVLQYVLPGVDVDELV